MERLVIDNISFNPHWQHFDIKSNGQWKSGYLKQNADKLIFTSFGKEFELILLDEYVEKKFLEALVKRYCILSAELEVLSEDIKKEMPDFNMIAIPTSITNLLIKIEGKGIFEKYNGTYKVCRYRGYDGVRLMYLLDEDMANNIKGKAILDLKKMIENLEKNI